MSAYIKLSTLEYPRHEGDIRIEYPEILETQTGPTFPCPSTYALVEPSDPPAFDEATQFLAENAPVLTNGVWRQQWRVQNFTEMQLNILRETSLKYRKPQNLDVQGSTPNVIG
jgi:hypothetical protein